ncbi:MAG: M23 family metallopeptidase [Lachnoclostridium sp.]|jgi:murein DD-endopeptidase MepM/ murein hydrolase activator NlpD|nr:M23 family metallopeptidase [Lachnoclostridium sp.]
MIRFIIVIVIVVIESKVILVGGDAKSAIPLKQNIKKFRSFQVSSEALTELSEDNTKEWWTRNIAINMCKNDGEIPEDEKLLDDNSLYALLIPQRIVLQYQTQLMVLLGDVRLFPVPKDLAGGAAIKFDNSWGGKRAYGGERVHEGCDIMTSNNIAGYFPVQSMTDGVVEKIGWLDMGGYRIGIRAPGGAFFYYAHLDEYADGLEIGSKVEAGQMLGRMGNTGYGKEGTTGKFDTHLHVGIYVNIDDREVSINPYSILKFIEKYRQTF